MQILSCDGGCKMTFGGKIDRKTERFIRKQIKMMDKKLSEENVVPNTRKAVFARYRMRSLADLKSFMSEFNKDTVLKLDLDDLLSSFYIFNKKSKSKLDFSFIPYNVGKVYKDKINVASPHIDKKYGTPEKIMKDVRDFTDNFVKVEPKLVDGRLYELSRNGGRLGRMKENIDRFDRFGFVGEVIKKLQVRRYNNLVSELGHSEEKILK